MLTFQDTIPLRIFLHTSRNAQPTRNLFWSSISVTILIDTITATSAVKWPKANHIVLLLCRQLDSNDDNWKMH